MIEAIMIAGVMLAIAIIWYEERIK